jgi:hypothetical protein
MPHVENGGLGIDKIAVGGRPLQITLDDKKRAMIHHRVIELITIVQPKVFGTVNPSKIVDLFKLEEGTRPPLGLRTSDVVSGFYSFLGFPRLLSDTAIGRAIVQGVRDRVFGYTTGSPKLGEAGKYEIDRRKVAFDSPLADDEVDLKEGFLIVPSAIPAAVQPGGPLKSDEEKRKPNKPKPLEESKPVHGRRRPV